METTVKKTYLGLPNKVPKKIQTLLHFLGIENERLYTRLALQSARRNHPEYNIVVKPAPRNMDWDKGFLPGQGPSYQRRVPQSFWDRVEDVHALGKEAKELYHQRAKEIRTDLTENHEEAVMLNAIWEKTKHIFAHHGVIL